MGATDDDLLKQMEAVLNQVGPWMARIDPDNADPDPRPRSPMSKDDELADPFRVSHGAWSSLSHAADHLDCLRILVIEAKIIHMFAPYSVVRGALENACTAVWALAPSSRRERVLRRLRLAVSDITHGEAVQTLTGGTGPRPLSERLEQVSDIAKRAGITDRVKRVSYSEIVRNVGEPPRPVVTEVCWRLCSGFAHGDLWPTLTATERIELPGGLPGMASLSITADLQTLLRMTMTATMLARRGWDLYDLRCSTPY